MKNLMKSFWILALLINAAPAWAHKDEPPCNDESLEDAREREQKEKDHDHHDHDHHHHD